MATPVIMPRQGQSVESCIIGEWHKKEGDKVAVGDNLFTYETDKATFDEAATVAGTMLAVFFQVGDDVPCLTNVCVIGEPGEDVSQFNPNGGAKAEAPTAATAATAAAPAPVAESAPSPVAAPAATQPQGENAFVSPRAKNLAARTGADLRMAQGSGPDGRVIERDVKQLVDAGIMATPAAGAYPAGTTGTGIGGRVTAADAAAPAAAPKAAPAASVAEGPESWTEKHTNIRKVIARSMHKSISDMAQLTLNTTYDASDVMALRKRLKKAGEQGLGDKGFELAASIPTLGDILLYAVSRTLLKFPACNAHYDDEKMTYFKHVNLGVAIDTPRGLMVPTLFKADQMSLAEISTKVKEYADACRSGSISPDLLAGGTFTVTNLGTFGVENFTPVINPPQTCILGVGNIVTRVRETNGAISTYPAMGLSLTLDHRAIDGAPAARMLKDLASYLENFSLMALGGRN